MPVDKEHKSLLDSLTNVCIYLCAIVEAAQQWLKDAPNLVAKAPFLDLTGGWNYIPLLLITAGAVLWFLKHAILFFSKPPTANSPSGQPSSPPFAKPVYVPQSLLSDAGQKALAIQRKQSQIAQLKALRTKQITINKVLQETDANGQPIKFMGILGKRLDNTFMAFYLFRREVQVTLKGLGLDGGLKEKLDASDARIRGDVKFYVLSPSDPEKFVDEECKRQWHMNHTALQTIYHFLGETITRLESEVYVALHAP